LSLIYIYWTQYGPCVVTSPNYSETSDQFVQRYFSILDYLLHQAYVSFRRYCLEAEALPVDLHVVVSDILQGAGHVDDIFPYFLRHARQMFPHLECMDDLKKISDLRSPANW